MTICTVNDVSVRPFYYSLFISLINCCLIFVGLKVIKTELFR